MFHAWSCWDPLAVWDEPSSSTAMSIQCSVRWSISRGHLRLCWRTLEPVPSGPRKALPGAMAWENRQLRVQYNSILEITEIKGLCRWDSKAKCHCQRIAFRSLYSSMCLSRLPHVQEAWKMARKQAELKRCPEDCTDPNLDLQSICPCCQDEGAALLGRPKSKMPVK